MREDLKRGQEGKKKADRSQLFFIQEG